MDILLIAVAVIHTLGAVCQYMVDKERTDEMINPPPWHVLPVRSFCWPVLMVYFLRNDPYIPEWLRL